jgi:hypothetical protein
MMNSWTLSDSAKRTSRKTPAPALLSMIWAAWFGAQPPVVQQALLFRARDLNFADRASRATAEPVLLLRQLQRRPAATPEVSAIVDGLLAGMLLLHVPPMLAATLDARDANRDAWAVEVRAAARGAMTPAEKEAASLVIAWLVGMKLVGDGGGARLNEDAGGYVGAVLRDLGLPTESLTPQLVEIARA